MADTIKISILSGAQVYSGGEMIPKDSYILFCRNNSGEERIVYPCYYEDSNGKKHFRCQDTMYMSKPTYISDYKYVLDYIKSSDLFKFDRIVLAKVVDLISVETKSLYTGENK